MFDSNSEILCLFLFPILVIIIYNAIAMYYKHPLTEKEIQNLSDDEKKHVEWYVKNRQEAFTRDDLNAYRKVFNKKKSKKNNTIISQQLKYCQKDSTDSD